MQPKTASATELNGMPSNCSEVDCWPLTKIWMLKFPVMTASLVTVNWAINTFKSSPACAWVSPNNVNHDPPFSELTTRSPPVEKAANAVSMPTVFGWPVTSFWFIAPNVIHESYSMAGKAVKKAGLMVHPTLEPNGFW